MKQEDAYKIAEKHCTGIRWDGSPSIGHIRRTAQLTEDIVRDVFNEDYLNVVKCAAILHDVIEDCLDKDEFDNSALDDVIIFDDVHSGLLEIVSTLTHRKDEPYENYISRVINSPNLAPTCIKIADMIDNLTSKGVTLKQQAKYRRALPRLIKRFRG